MGFRFVLGASQFAVDRRAADGEQFGQFGDGVLAGGVQGEQDGAFGGAELGRFPFQPAFGASDRLVRWILLSARCGARVSAPRYFASAR